MMYEEMILPLDQRKISIEQILRDEALESFQLRTDKTNKILY